MNANRKGASNSFSEIRKKKRLTQEAIADKLGIKQSTVAMWESGKSVPSMRNLIALEGLLGVSASMLIDSFPKNKS